MASKHNGTDFSTAWARGPPPSLPIGRRIANIFYNHEDKSFLGRTPKRWGIFLTFYLCFYAGLAMLFSICFGALYYSVDYHRPYYTLHESLIGASPGMDFRPRSEVVPILSYSLGNSSSVDHYLNQVQDFLKAYENSSWYKSQKECVTADNFGFPEAPCFYIKLNKIYDWRPDIYDGVKNDLPEDMPEELQTHVMSLDPLQRQKIWLSCEEEDTHHGNSSIAIEYPWGRGLPGKYYPYVNSDGYMSPLLAIKLTPPGVIGLIYLVMYICIAIFFSICMTGLLATVDTRVPYYRLADSIIGNNPGMGHRPQLFGEGTLIWYNHTNSTQINKYIENLDGFLGPYWNKSLLKHKGLNQIECGMTKPPREQVCAFNLTQLGPCNKENGYGYAAGKPCFVIKLNRIYDWKPEFYDDPGALPKDMPPDIVALINQSKEGFERRKVWVSCKGERPADNEAIGPLKYWPYPGLDETFYPYDNTNDYLSPIVAVQLENPTRGVIINIRCRGWAKNLVYSDSLKDRIGSTHLEIMID